MCIGDSSTNWSVKWSQRTTSLLVLIAYRIRTEIMRKIKTISSFTIRRIIIVLSVTSSSCSTPPRMWRSSAAATAGMTDD
jgi:hypothetical protein